MADLRTLPATYTEGSRWPPGDYNGIAQSSLAYDQNWQREHTDDPVGEHDSLRIAYAGGYVSFTGGTTYVASPESHITSVTRISAGEVLVTLDIDFRSAGKWGAIVWQETVEGTTGEVPVELDTGKMTNAVRVRLADATDGDFWFFAFGVK